MKIGYNRQINRKVLYLGFLTFPDFFVMITGIGIFTALQRIHVAVLFVFCYMLYGVVFRLGRAPGYDMHFFRRLMSPIHRRPGHLEQKYPYKVK